MAYKYRGTQKLDPDQVIPKVGPRGGRKCGTEGGYGRHRQAGEKPCQPCATAHAHNKARRVGRKITPKTGVTTPTSPMRNLRRRNQPPQIERTDLFRPQSRRSKLPHRIQPTQEGAGSMTEYVHLTDTASIGGRGKEARVPETQPMHTLTMTRTQTSGHVDWFITAEEAITARVRRLKEQGVTFIRDGLTLTFTDRDGTAVTLTYREPA